MTSEGVEEEGQGGVTEARFAAIRNTLDPLDLKTNALSDTLSRCIFNLEISHEQPQKKSAASIGRLLVLLCCVAVWKRSHLSPSVHSHTHIRN